MSQFALLSSKVRNEAERCATSGGSGIGNLVSGEAVFGEYKWNRLFRSGRIGAVAAETGELERAASDEGIASRFGR